MFKYAKKWNIREITFGLRPTGYILSTPIFGHLPSLQTYRPKTRVKGQLGIFDQLCINLLFFKSYFLFSLSIFFAVLLSALPTTHSKPEISHYFPHLLFTPTLLTVPLISSCPLLCSSLVGRIDSSGHAYIFFNELKVIYSDARDFVWVCVLFIHVTGKIFSPAWPCTRLHPNSYIPRQTLKTIKFPRSLSVAV